MRIRPSTREIEPIRRLVRVSTVALALVVCAGTAAAQGQPTLKDAYAGAWRMGTAVNEAVVAIAGFDCRGSESTQLARVRVFPHLFH